MADLFQTENYFKDRFRVISRKLGFHATHLSEEAIWRAELQGKLRELLGIDHLIPTPHAARVTEVVQRDGYRCERVEIDTEPGVTMPMFVLIPDQIEANTPVLIAAHGHGSAGKTAIVGDDSNSLVAAKIKQHNYDYARQAVKRGFIVFAPDARGFGERREWNSAKPEQILDSSCFQLAHMALPLGLTIAGMWAWDLMRLIDYIETREDMRGRKLGGIGFSGGGLQMLYLSALDPRLQCLVISGYFYGVHDSLLHLSNNCNCNYVPHLWEYADIGDLGALLAPRPLLIESARQDPLNGPRGIKNVEEQVEITRNAYALHGATACLDTDFFAGEHQWHGTVAWDWLSRWLR